MSAPKDFRTWEQIQAEDLTLCAKDSGVLSPLMDECVGRLILGGRGKILSAPEFHEPSGETRCIANVDGMLCLIAVTVKLTKEEAE